MAASNVKVLLQWFPIEHERKISHQLGVRVEVHLDVLSRGVKIQGQGAALMY